MKSMMNHTVNNAQSLQGFVFCYLGFVLDSSTITAVAGLVSAMIGFLMMIRMFQKTSIEMRLNNKMELKIDLETRKAELEVHLLEQEVSDYDDDNIRQNKKRI